MNILWNIHLYPPAHNCGSEYFSHHLNKFLVSKGHRVRVILQQSNSIKSFIHYNIDGVEVFPATGHLDAFRWGDVICTHLDYTQFTITMAMAVKRPIVHFVHNDIPYSSVENAIRGAYVVYNSDWIRKSIGYNWPSIVLTPPADFDFYNVNEKPIESEYITLISLNERKGGYFFYEIAKRMPGKKFLGVIGSYDNPGKLKLSQNEIINMLSELPNVTLLPNTPNIRDVYRKTRVLLMPSDYESWGMTATEAMCNGIPVICTPTAGLKENCGEAGIFVGKQIKAEPGEPCADRGSVQDWVEAIHKLDDNKIYSNFSAKSRERAKNYKPDLEGAERFITSAVF